MSHDLFIKIPELSGMPVRSGVDLICAVMLELGRGAESLGIEIERVRMISRSPQSTSNLFLVTFEDENSKVAFKMRFSDILTIREPQDPDPDEVPPPHKPTAWERFKTAIGA